MRRVRPVKNSRILFSTRSLKFVVRVIMLVDIASVPEEMLLLVEFIFQVENLMRQTIQFESFLLNFLSVLEGQNRVKVSNNQATSDANDFVNAKSHVREKQFTDNCSYSCGLRVLGAQGLAVRNMHSLHTSTDF